MTSAQQIIDQELAQFGWVESIATNSISDFKSPKSNIKKKTIKKINTLLTNLFFTYFFI